MVLSSGLIVNSTSSRIQRPDLRQSVSRIESMGLRATPDGYATADGLALALEPIPGQSPAFALVGDGIGERLRGYGVARMLAATGDDEYALAREGPARVGILGLHEAPPPDVDLWIRGFAIKSLYPPSS